MENKLIWNKSQMYDLYQNGAFGNRSRSWLSVRDFENDGCPCNVGIRYKDPRGGAGPFVPNIHPDDLEFEVHKLVSLGWHRRYMVLGEVTPDNKLLMNGELIEDESLGYALHYSIIKTNMRASLKAGPQWINGPGVMLILQSIFNPSSYADLRALLDNHPMAAIEFSAYSICLGNVPGRNVLIWEVRHY